MNYIKKLEYLNKNCEATLAATAAAIDNTLLYLESTKFHCGDELDGYVAVKDMQLRTREIKSSLLGE